MSDFLKSALNIAGQIISLIIFGLALTAFLGATHQAIMLALVP